MERPKYSTCASAIDLLLWMVFVVCVGTEVVDRVNVLLLDYNIMYDFDIGFD